LHVYVPIVSFLLVAPLLVNKFTGWRQPVGAVLVLVAAASHAGYVVGEARRFQSITEEVRNNLVAYPDSPVVIWGESFPYDVVYPVLRASSAAVSYEHFGLGTSTLIPYVVAETERQAGRGFPKLLSSEQGVPL